MNELGEYNYLTGRHAILISFCCLKKKCRMFLFNIITGRRHGHLITVGNGLSRINFFDTIIIIIYIYFFFNFSFMVNPSAIMPDK